jgi:hypothetical protein
VQQSRFWNLSDYSLWSFLCDGVLLGGLLVTS